MRLTGWSQKSASESQKIGGYAPNGHTCPSTGLMDFPEFAKYFKSVTFSHKWNEACALTQ